MPRQTEARDWYFACDCGAKFCHQEDSAECPRCGERLAAREPIEPRWNAKLMRVAEVARALSISASKTYELIEKGRLEHYRIDGAIRVSEEQLRDYLNERMRGRTAAEWPKKTDPRARPKLRFVRK